MHIDKNHQIIVGKMQKVISDLVRENYELNERLDLAAREREELKDIISKMIDASLEVDPYF